MIPHEECAWFDYCNNFEKSIGERVFSVKATNLQHARLDEKEIAKSLMVFLRNIIHPLQSKKYLRA